MRAAAARPTTWALLALLAVSPACSKSCEPGTESTPMPISSAGAQVIVGQHGFAPSSLSLSKGAAGSTVPVTFVRTTDETCAKEVVFPDVGIQRDLPLNTPVTIDVPADSPRTLKFQCGMAMYKGSLVVK